MKILCSLLLLLTAPWVLSQPSTGRGVLHGGLTFEASVFWSDVPLPAGHYTLAIELRRSSAGVTLNSAQGKTWEFSPFGVLAGAESGQSQVCLTLLEDRWEVRSVNLPQFGLSLLYVPRNRQGNRVTPRSNCVPITMDGLGGA
jgi:hypothetical protein